MWAPELTLRSPARVVSSFTPWALLKDRLMPRSLCSLALFFWPQNWEVAFGVETHMVITRALLFEGITWSSHRVCSFGGLRAFLKPFNWALLRSFFSKCLAVFVSSCCFGCQQLQMTEGILVHRHRQAFLLSRVSFGMCCICILLTTVMDMHRQCSDGLDRQQLKLAERASTSLVSFSFCVSILGLSYTNSNTHFTNRSEYQL